MLNDTIINIGRQYGSGGRDIGIKLAEDLNVPYYDKELLKRAAKNSGLCEKLFESFDEKPKSLLYSLVVDPYSFNPNPTGYGLIEEDVYVAVFEAVRKIADEGPCVIIGRCADYALKDYKKCLNLFIYAPIEKRIERIANAENISEEKAKERIKKVDKQRASYYNFYTNKKWGDVKSYDYCIDSSVLGIDGTADLIKYILEKKKLKAE